MRGLSKIPKCEVCGSFLWWRNHRDGSREYYCKYCMIDRQNEIAKRAEKIVIKMKEPKQ